MTPLHTLSIFSINFTWNAFPTVSRSSHIMLSTCWLLFLHSAVQLIPNPLNWVGVGWLCMPGHLMQHSTTTLTQPGGVFWVIVLLKTIYSPTNRKPDGMAYRCKMVRWPCWLTVPWIINKSLPVSPAMHPHNITPPPCFTVGTTHGDNPFTYFESHKDTLVGTKNLTFGLIRPKDRFPPV
jgi:hypothetical protein